MVDCKTCSVYIGEDRRRKYCDKHHEFRRGEWRRKGRNKEYFREKKQKYSIRQTRVTGTGFSEHLRTDPRTGEPLFRQERIAVRKEKKRIGI